MQKTANTYVLFDVSDATYAVRSDIVQHIEIVERITPVPNAARFVEGVVFSRGQVIPAISLRARFGCEPKSHDLRSRLLVLQSRGGPIGLIADSAREFVTIEDAAIQAAHEAITNLSGQYLVGIATFNNRIVLVLDLPALLERGDDGQGSAPPTHHRAKPPRAASVSP